MPSMTIKFDSKNVVFRCPECMENLGLTQESTPDYAVCPHCAAIGYFDMKKRLYRMPKTEEWLAVVTLSGFWDLLDMRERIVAKITAPQPPPVAKPHAEQPRAPVGRSR